MRLRVGRCILVIVLALSPLTLVASSTPSFQGLASGIELCPQSICGAALFVGGFQGSVNGRPASGIFVSAVNHDFLPEVGQDAEIFGGLWSIHTWRGRFRGDVLGGRLFNINDTQFCVEMTLRVLEGGTGEVNFTGILDHGPFPPTINGAITQAPPVVGCPTGG